ILYHAEFIEIFQKIIEAREYKDITQKAKMILLLKQITKHHDRTDVKDFSTVLMQSLEQEVDKETQEKQESIVKEQVSQFSKKSKRTEKKLVSCIKDSGLTKLNQSFKLVTKKPVYHILSICLSIFSALGSSVALAKLHNLKQEFQSNSGFSQKYQLLQAVIHDLSVRVLPEEAVKIINQALCGMLKTNENNLENKTTDQIIDIIDILQEEVSLRSHADIDADNFMRSVNSLEYSFLLQSCQITSNHPTRDVTSVIVPDILLPDKQSKILSVKQEKEKKTQVAHVQSELTPTITQNNIKKTEKDNTPETLQTHSQVATGYRQPAPNLMSHTGPPVDRQRPQNKSLNSQESEFINQTSWDPTRQQFDPMPQQQDQQEQRRMSVAPNSRQSVITHQITHERLSASVAERIMNRKQDENRPYVENTYRLKYQQSSQQNMPQDQTKLPNSMMPVSPQGQSVYNPRSQERLMNRNTLAAWAPASQPIQTLQAMNRHTYQNVQAAWAPASQPIQTLQTMNHHTNQSSPAAGAPVSQPLQSSTLKQQPIQTLKTTLDVGYDNSGNSCYINATLKAIMPMMDAEMIQAIQNRKSDDELENRVRNAFIALYYASYAQDATTQKVRVYLQDFMAACQNAREVSQKTSSIKREIDYKGFSDIALSRQGDTDEFLKSLNHVLWGDNSNNMIREPSYFDTKHLTYKGNKYLLSTVHDPSSVLIIPLITSDDYAQVSSPGSMQEAFRVKDKETVLPEYFVDMDNLTHTLDTKTAQNVFNELKEEFPPVSDNHKSKNILPFVSKPNQEIITATTSVFPENTKKCSVFFTSTHFATGEGVKSCLTVQETIKQSNTFSMKFPVMQASGKTQEESFQLKSLVVHLGSTLTSGHYLSYVIDNNEIFCHNDSFVTKIPRNPNETLDSALKRELLKNKTATPTMACYEKVL
ncbi:MAG: ubiquitin carboxyl-terminal hydrolase, partial [Endozoicomonadaceae bacterium]|nr:ubiquitin carboxyl-terminal hydrolase [Endozoicomonadaceae bacterium]